METAPAATRPTISQLVFRGSGKFRVTKAGITCGDAFTIQEEDVGDNNEKRVTISSVQDTASTYVALLDGIATAGLATDSSFDGIPKSSVGKGDGHTVINGVRYVTYHPSSGPHMGKQLLVPEGYHLVDTAPAASAKAAASVEKASKPVNDFLFGDCDVAIKKFNVSGYCRVCVCDPTIFDASRLNVTLSDTSKFKSQEAKLGGDLEVWCSGSSTFSALLSAHTVDLRASGASFIVLPNAIDAMNAEAYGISIIRAVVHDGAYSRKYATELANVYIAKQALPSKMTDFPLSPKQLPPI